MLIRHQPSRRSFLAQTLSLATIAGLSIAGSGCASIVGVQDVEFNDILIPPEAQKTATFFRWNEFTIGIDTSSVERATLLAVTIDVQEPKGTADLSFLQSVLGEAVLGTMRTPVAICTKFPPGEQAVVMQVLYRDDLRPLLRHDTGGDTIRIEWTGQMNPAFTKWPPTGFVLRARAKIKVE